MRHDRLARVLVILVAGLTILPLVLFPQTVTPDAPNEAAASHARVVRLSYVSGNVSVKRPDSSEWEKAMVNTPLQEGFELATSDNGFAEVEFENGSTARLGELSRLTFNQLALDAQGAKLNRLTFEQGYATFHVFSDHQLAEHPDVYSISIADATLTPERKSEFRTDFFEGQLRIEVFHGSVRVATPTKSVKVGENKTLEYRPGAPEEAFQIHEGIVKDEWDKWAEARDTQQQLALRDESVKAQQGLYGWSDLDTYGEWANIPGSGYGWAPYAQMGWSPYTSGMWNWYPSMGWTWISSEPWGWLPYHCGLWDYDFAFGWYWMPAGGCGFWNPALVSWFGRPGWIGWRPVGGTGLSGGPPRPIHPPRPVPLRPGTNVVTTVPASVFQSRQIITPQMVSHVDPVSGAAMQHSPPGPSALAVNAAGSLASGPSALPTSPPRSNAQAFVGSAVPGAAARNTPAPPTILMGGNREEESALFQTHEQDAHRQPLREVTGPTLGGQLMMLARPGESRGEAIRGPLSYGWSGAVVMSHGHSWSPHMSNAGVISRGHVGALGLGGGRSGGGGYSASGGSHVGGGGHVSGGYSGGGGHSSGGGHSGGGGGHR